MAQDYPVIRWLLEYRSLTTRINTFSVGFPQFIHPVTKGTNATIIKRAIALLDSTLLVKVPEIKLILVVHDEIVLEVPHELADKAARCLSDCAVKAAKPILNPIPVEVEVKVLNSWGD